ncbi:MAG: hypothetical protein L0Z62_13755 [Gemmataceae bacterium]|nr:hypothetical protein [Gemmataceae bacterium]
MRQSQRPSWGLLGVVLALLTLAAVDVAGKPPPPCPVTLPGDPTNAAQTRWLAPYVLTTRVSVGESWTTSVRWFSPDGKVKRELSGPKLVAQPGFIYDYSNRPTTIHGVHGDWQFALPKKPGSAPSIDSTPDGRVFVHQFHPAQGQIAADLYVAGKCVGTVGPFLQYESRNVRVGDDGSIGLLVWKDESKKVPQVIAAGPDGKITVKADCDGPVDAPKAAPDGVGVLVQPNTGEGRNTWSYYTRGGKQSTLYVGPNAYLVCWLPGTTRALCSTALGSTYRFHLIDWAKGRRLWAIDDPNPARAGSSGPQVASLGGLLLFAGLESIRLGGNGEPVRSLQAVEARTGQVVARWHPTPLKRFADGDRLVRQGERLFLVADDEFAEIRLQDVARGKHGWK